MASRDLTNFFIRSRSLFHRPKASYAGGGDSGGDLLSASGDASVDMSSLALSGASPVYVETVNELQADLTSITARREWRAQRHSGRPARAPVWASPPAALSLALALDLACVRPPPLLPLTPRRSPPHTHPPLRA
jgi:hypothetical protein